MIFSLNKKFYGKESIIETINDFKDVCKGRIIEEKKGLIKIEITPKEKICNLKEEFCNYALGLMKNKI